MPLFALEAPYGTSEEYIISLQIQMNEQLENLKNKISFDVQEPIMKQPIIADTTTINDLCFSAFKIGLMIIYFDTMYPRGTKIKEYFIIGNNAVMILHQNNMPSVRITIRYDNNITVDIQNISPNIINSNHDYCQNIINFDNSHEIMSYLGLFYA